MTALRTVGRLRVASTSALLPRLPMVLFFLTVGANALYLLGLILGGVGPLVDVGLSLATSWLPAAAFGVVAARPGIPRVPVLLATAALTVNALGDTYYTVAMDADGFLPFPSPADVAYLLFYPLTIAALIAVMHGRLRGGGALVLLEAGVATLGASAVLAVMLEPVIVEAAAHDDPLSGAVAVAYPLFDVLLIAVIAGIMAVPGVRVGRRGWALVTGLGLFAVADLAFALLASSGTYLAGTPLDATWAIGLALMVWWVVGVGVLPAAPRRARSRRLVFPLPPLAALAGLAVLITATQVPLSPLPVVLAGATVALGVVPVVFRQALLGRLLAAQEEAVRRLIELDQAKTDILVTMNHEFRTPLTTINGNAELLADGAGGELSPAAQRMAEKIERNGARLQALIDATLTSTKLEVGSEPLHLESSDLADVTECAISANQRFAASRHVTIARDISDGVVVEADALHLQRALANLVDNAVKFSSEGGAVHVSVGRHPRTAEALVRVSDSGIGIPASDRSQLFGRFFRASNVQNAAIPGVGLGLSISRSIVEAHGGSIDLESELGRGTTVTVRLPLARRPRARRPTRSPR